jgi:hypothetical protein
VKLRVVKTCKITLQQPSYWQLVFQQSTVNGADYRGEYLPGFSWSWPEDTYLQRRLRDVRTGQIQRVQAQS